MSRGQQPPECTLDIGPSTVSSDGNAKCLGILWSHNYLSPKASIEHNINKARGAFFGLGSLGIYHGKQNPLPLKCMRSVPCPYASIRK